MSVNDTIFRSEPATKSGDQAYLDNLRTYHLPALEGLIYKLPYDPVHAVKQNFEGL
jgi:hypothetical protein